MNFKILGIQFGKTSAPTQPIVAETRVGQQSYSTPFLSVGGGNLALPRVRPYYNVNGYVPFGSDNLYPQLLNQMYYTSPLHGAIINFKINATIGGGFEIVTDKSSAKDKLMVATFEKVNGFNKLVKQITADVIIHNRVTLLLHFNDKKELIKIKGLGPETVRKSEDGSRYFWSSDWSRYIMQKEYKPYSPLCDDKIQLWEWQDNFAGQDVYALPSYSSALNWCFLDGDQSFLHKANIQNSIFASMIISLPKNFQSNDEAQKYIEHFRNNTGAENAGKVILLANDSKDDMPEITVPATSQNDKLFLQTDKSIKDNICFAHEINPSIMGIKVAGSLGNAQELEMSYAIFEKNVVKPLRIKINEIVEDILGMAKISNEFVINEYQIIEGQVVENGTKTAKVVGPDASTIDDVEAEAKANLKGTVGGVQGILEIQKSVSEGTTSYDSALEILDLIYGITKENGSKILGRPIAKNE